MSGLPCLVFCPGSSIITNPQAVGLTRLKGISSHVLFGTELCMVCAAIVDEATQTIVQASESFVDFSSVLAILHFPYLSSN